MSLLKTARTDMISQELYRQALELMPGGVNSPVRAFKSIDNNPIFISKAKGSIVWDEDGNRYIDYLGSWGPMILGHADSDIETSLMEVLRSGTSFGAPTRLENDMAAEIIKLVPSIEMVRMVNSGTEAVMAALRLARAFTGRNKIVKFSGCYHGHVDNMLVQAGSGIATLGLPNSPGVTESASKDTLVVQFNDEEAVKAVFKNYGGEIAALITEPVLGNAGCILAKPGFLEFLREITNAHDSLLIFDEVMTGFRVAMGGAQEYYNVLPDITTLGKIIGGGLPVGAYGARKEIMQMIAPSGPVYQAGTLSGNPLAMTAGLTCLRKIQRPGFYKELESKVQYLIDGFKKVNHESSIDEIKNSQFAFIGGMFGFFFTKEKVQNYQNAKTVNLSLFKKYYLGMLEQGVYFAPSAFEAAFMSDAHSYDDLDSTIDAHKIVVESIILR